MINNLNIIRETFADISGNDFSASNIMSTIFKSSGLYILAACVVVYLVVSVVFGSRTENTGTLFDLAVFSCLIGFGIYKYLTSTETNKNILRSGTQEMVDFLEDPISLFTSVVFIISFYCVVFLLQVPTNELAPIAVMLMGFMGWGLIVFLIIHNALKTLFHVDLMELMRDPKWVATTDASGNAITKVVVENITPEVFNISNNSYTYDDSQAICRAYDARLANYDEIETAYNNGAEWCNYGWSADQMAFFPTQKKTWQDLQGSEKHKNNCGRPGVNGGYFANTNIKFGVNCFGIKPKAKENDVSWMNAKNSVPYPQTEEEEELEKQVEYWKNELDDKLQVSSFNKERWSRY